MRPRIILVAHDVGGLGGMERALEELVRHASASYDVTVVSSTLTPELRPLVRWRRARVPRRPVPLKLVAFFVVAGARLALRRDRAAVVHTCGAIVPNRADVVSVHTCHAAFVEQTGLLAPHELSRPRRLNSELTRRLALLAERLVYRPSRTGCFAAVSAGVADELRRHYPGIPVRITPNGVDARRFHLDADARRSVRAELDVADDAVVALFVGGDWGRKGLALAVAASARAGCSLWVVGRGRANGLSASTHVRFLGPRGDTQRFYAAADVFVLPSLYEAAPLALLEAAASGLPVVTTAVNGAREVAGDDEAGVVVERDAAALGDALAALAADAALRSRMGAAARRRVTGLTWTKSAEATVALYGADRPRRGIDARDQPFDDRASPSRGDGR